VLAALGAVLITPGVASAEAPYINIKHANSPHRCLDANDQGDVYTHDCTGSDFQKWFNYTEAGYGKFKHKKTGQCLAASATAVFLTSCTSNASDWRSDPGQPRYIWNRNGKYLNGSGGPGAAPVGPAAGRTGTSRWLIVNT
jgi:hypothetical protein